MQISWNETTCCFWKEIKIDRLHFHVWIAFGALCRASGKMQCEKPFERPIVSYCRLCLAYWNDRWNNDRPNRSAAELIEWKFRRSLHIDYRLHSHLPNQFERCGSQVNTQVLNAVLILSGIYSLQIFDFDQVRVFQLLQSKFKASYFVFVSSKLTQLNEIISNRFFTRNFFPEKKNLFFIFWNFFFSYFWLF